MHNNSTIDVSHASQQRCKHAHICKTSETQTLYKYIQIISNNQKKPLHSTPSCMRHCTARKRIVRVCGPTRVSIALQLSFQVQSHPFQAARKFNHFSSLQHSSNIATVPTWCRRYIMSICLLSKPFTSVYLLDPGRPARFAETTKRMGPANPWTRGSLEQVSPALTPLRP